ncbi:MAG: ABC transporter permease, partial [Acidimicrobiia bacterium]
MTAVTTLPATRARKEQLRAIEHDARREQARVLGLIVPALVLLAALLLTPLGWLLWQSVIGSEGLTTVHYQRIIDDVGYHNSFWLTFKISGLVTILAILIGYPLSYMLSRLKPIWAGIGIGLVIIPFWT